MARTRALVLIAGLMAAGGGCGGEDKTGQAIDAASGGDVALGSADAGVEDASAAEAATAAAGDATSDMQPEVAGPFERGIRFAHFAYMIAAMDFCVAPNAQDGVFAGPLLKSAGQAAGLAYGQVSAYQLVPLGLFKVRVVAAGAADCNTALFDFGANVPNVTLNGNNFATMVFQANGLGEAVPIRQKLTQDPVGGAPKGNVILAVRNATSMRIDFGPVVGGTFMAAFRNVDEFAQMTMSDQMAATFEVRMSGAKTALLTGSNITLPEQTTWTAFTFGIEFSVATPPALLFCPNVAAGGTILDCSGH